MTDLGTSAAVAWRLILGTSADVGKGVAIPAQLWVAPVWLWPTSAADSDDAPPPAVDRVHIIAESTVWLRRFLTDPRSLVTVKHVTVVIDSWRPPRRGWYGRLGPLPGVVRHEIRYPRISGRSMVDVVLEEPGPLRLTLAAVLGALTPVRPLPASVSADIGVSGTPPHWLPPQIHGATLFGSPPGEDVVRPYDMILGDELDPADPRRGEQDPSPLIETTTAAARSRMGGDLIMVDAIAVNPRGRRDAYGPAGRQVTLEIAATDDPLPYWRMVGVDDGQIVAEGEPGRVDLTEAHLEALRSVGLVSCDGLKGEDPGTEAVLLAQFAATGAAVRAANLPDATAALLVTELRDAIQADLPVSVGDPLDWEILSIRQRRAALRGHAVGFALPRIGSATYSTMSRLPTVSALLVTRRPEYLAKAVAAIERQTYPELEIVLGLHGCELPHELRARLLACSRPIEIISVSSDARFGEALGVVTRSARGTLVAKFDDDDIYGPEHVWDLVLARHYSGATIVGKGAEFVYIEPLGITVRRTAMVVEDYTVLVAGGTMLIAKGDLEDVGGWRPVRRSVDRGLLERVLRSGGLVYRTHPLGYVYQRRSAGHTWDPGTEYFLRRSGPQWHGLPQFSEFGEASPQTAR